MYRLSKASEEALGAYCASLPDSHAELVRTAIERVRQDPSGRREPRHRYTRPFRAAKRYVAVAPQEKVWEFKMNHCRALFVTDDVERNLVFVPVGGKRFFHPRECPWPH